MGLQPTGDEAVVRCKIRKNRENKKEVAKYIMRVRDF